MRRRGGGGGETGAVLILEDESRLVSREGMRASKPAHHREVADDVHADTIESVSILRSPGAVVCVVRAASVGAEDKAAHVPHLHARNLINRETRNRETPQVKREWIGGSSIIS